MELSVNQKIKSILEENQMSITALAKKIDMQQVTCNRQIKGEQAVSLSLIQGFLLVFPEISAEWLIRGDGEREKCASMSTQETSKEKEKLSVTEKLSESDIWKARYEELEKRYNQLIGVLGKGGI